MGLLIDGEAGFGYALLEDPSLPAQQLTRLEAEALSLAVSALASLADPELVGAAQAALRKITATLPSITQHQILHKVSRAYERPMAEVEAVDLGLLREACWSEAEVSIAYVDGSGKPYGPTSEASSTGILGRSGVIDRILHASRRLSDLPYPPNGET